MGVGEGSEKFPEWEFCISKWIVPYWSNKKSHLAKKLKTDLQRTINHGIDIASRLYSQRYINTWKIVQTTYKTRALVHLSWHCFCTLSQNLWPESRIDFPWQPAFQPKNKRRQKGMLLILSSRQINKDQNIVNYNM